MKEDVARKRLDEIIDMGNRLHGTATGSEMGPPYIPDEGAVYGWVASSRNLIGGVLGQESQYFSALAEALEGYPYASNVARAIGILQALRDDWDAGLLMSRELLITAEAFENFLEQADHLLEKGFEHPAGMLAGAVLESTLRKMCEVRGIPTDRSDKIGTLNDKLAKHHKPPAYGSMDHKLIIGWADLRNNADHGHFQQYKPEDVRNMIRWVREFAARHLA
jgi:hypothetical protein